VPPGSSGVSTTNTSHTFVGAGVGDPVGGVDGGVLGEGVGTIVGYGVVGDGVEIVGYSVGELVGPCVGTQCSRG